MNSSLAPGMLSCHHPRGSKEASIPNLSQSRVTFWGLFFCFLRCLQLCQPQPGPSWNEAQQLLAAVSRHNHTPHLEPSSRPFRPFPPLPLFGRLGNAPGKGNCSAGAHRLCCSPPKNSEQHQVNTLQPHHRIPQVGRDPSGSSNPTGILEVKGLPSSQLLFPGVMKQIPKFNSPPDSSSTKSRHL